MKHNTLLLSLIWDVWNIFGEPLFIMMVFTQNKWGKKTYDIFYIFKSRKTCANLQCLHYHVHNQNSSSIKIWYLCILLFSHCFFLKISSWQKDLCQSPMLTLSCPQSKFLFYQILVLCILLFSHCFFSQISSWLDEWTVINKTSKG